MDSKTKNYSFKMNGICFISVMLKEKVNKKMKIKNVFRQQLIETFLSLRKSKKRGKVGNGVEAKNQDYHKNGS